MFGIPVAWEMVSGVKVKFTPARFTWPSRKCRANKWTNSGWCWIWDIISQYRNHECCWKHVIASGQASIEPKKCAPLWRACHFYETSSVHLALRLNHCPAHIPSHMMNLFLTWCWKPGVWQIGDDKYMVKTRVCFSRPSVPHVRWEAARKYHHECNRLSSESEWKDSHSLFGEFLD